MIHVITGPPCGGKTTHVRESRRDGEPVVDFDAIAEAMGAESRQDANEEVAAIATSARTAAIRHILASPPKRDAWVIHCSPNAEDRARYEEAGAAVECIDPGIDECLRRAHDDGRPGWTVAAIRKWYAENGDEPDKEKASMQTRTKAFQVRVEEGDGGTITGYASTFDRTPDSYGDVVAPGAFEKSLAKWQELGKPIPLLFGHRTDDPFMNIGAVESAEEDERGLKFTARLDPDNPNAQYSRKLLLEGRIHQFSFAFEVMDAGPVTLEDGTKANELRELDLFEISLVPIPANQRATVEDVKAGRVLSKTNEDDLREAVSLIQGVLAKLGEPAKQPTEPEQDEGDPAEDHAAGKGARTLERIRETIAR